MNSRKDFLRMSIVCSLIVLLMLTSCAPPPAKAGEFVRSEAERVSSPDIPDKDMAELVGGNNAFAYELYQAWRGQEGNLFYSPYSISVALAMTYAGARGETEKQMAETLHFLLSQDDLHAALNGLDQELARRAAAAGTEEDEAFRLNIANSIWGQVGYDFLPAFLDILAENYGAGLRLADFMKNPDKSRVTINDWISDQTEARIEDLITEGAISPLTRLVLANAIYFKATWLHQFEESRTRDQEFNLLNGEQVSVPMMSLSEPPSLLYADGQGYQAVELPYVRRRGLQPDAVRAVVPDIRRDVNLHPAFRRCRGASHHSPHCRGVVPCQGVFTPTRVGDRVDIDLGVLAVGVEPELYRCDLAGNAADLKLQEALARQVPVNIAHRQACAIPVVGVDEVRFAVCVSVGCRGKRPGSGVCEFNC